MGEERAGDRREGGDGGIVRDAAGASTHSGGTARQETHLGVLEVSVYVCVCA